MKELEIPHHYQLYNDTAFPILELTKPYAIIYISKEYENSIPEPLKKAKTNLEELGNNKKKTNYKYTILISYSIIVTLAFLKYWHINLNNSQSKNFTFDWDFGNTTLYMKDKQTGKIVEMSIDNNYNLNFERTQAYSSKGDLISVSYDSNEDGNYEMVIFYGKNGEYAGINLDKDNDGIYERLEFVLSNKDTLKLVDKNSDGFYEIEN